MATVAPELAPYTLPQEFIDLRDNIARIARDRIAPRAPEIDRTAEYPQDIRELLAEHDILALPFDTEYGGTGTGPLMVAIAIEQIAAACAASSLILTLQDLATLPIRLFGSDEMKQRVLPKTASGEWLPAFALSEPDAGSDPGGMRTRAVRDGDAWVIDGAKNWISNSGVADFYVVFAVTDPDAGRSHGISCFLVEADRPGFSIGKLEEKLGMHGSPTGEVVLDDVAVPAANLIGEENRGFYYAMDALDRSRPIVGAQAVGIAQGALDVAARYVTERTQFDQRVADFQGVQFMLADLATQIEAARLLVYAAASRVDAGEPGTTKASAMAKLFASDVAMRVTTDAVQLLGGAGYTRDFPVERMMRDAKITQIYEGTNQIQRIVIARRLLDEIALGT